MLQNTEVINAAAHLQCKSLHASLLVEIICLLSGEVSSEFTTQGYSPLVLEEICLCTPMWESRNEKSESEENKNSELEFMIVGTTYAL